MKFVYFLGAGAAKPCGYPTTPDLFNTIVGSRPGLAIFKDAIYGQSLSAAAKAQPIDIEVLYHLVSQNVEEIINDVYGRLDPNSFEHQFVLGMLRRQTEWNRSVKDLVEAFRECQDAILDFIREQFWGIEADLSNYESLLVKTAEKRCGEENVGIFTTNYDTSLEDFFDEYAEYTEYDRGLDRDYFSPNNFGLPGRPGMKLVKLHGSIDLYRTKKGGIVRIKAFSQPGRWKGDDEIMGPYLVPPQMFKIDYDESQVKLLNIFDAYVRDAGIMVIIGSSFRDDRISEILSRAPKESSILICCGSKSPEHQKKWFPNHTGATSVETHFPCGEVEDWITSAIEEASG